MDASPLDASASADGPLPRRDFLKTAPLAAAAFMQVARGAPASLLAGMPAQSGPTRGLADASRRRIQAFDYQGVTLRDSRWKDKVAETRAFYLNLSNDDILHGFRLEAGLPAPGNSLGGWCTKDCQGVFGQWLSGMARMYRATGDAAYRDKASYLMAEWGKTVGADGDCRMRHYSYDKTICGLIDMHLYAGDAAAVPLLDKITDWAMRTLEHDNMIVVPSHNTLYFGKPQEWYTLAENLYRAYQLTGNPKYKTFGDIWLYHQYWNKFADNAAPTDADGVHAYSHVNTFSSAAMAYAVTGDAHYLQVTKNAYDFLQNTQCYATGGYGPNERLMATDGGLGKSLDARSDTFETGCGTWAAFKLARYLTEFTGEARYGDWIERLVYNGIGAALTPSGNGRNFYYSDYRVGGGMKVDRWDNFTCCSGTFIQDIADFHNLIYYKDATSLYVSLYMPSSVTWNRPDGDVTLVQDTAYPEAETSTLTLDMKRPQAFALKLRVPAWAQGMTVSVNGAPAAVRCPPGDWAVLSRTWRSGDRVDVRIPLRPRLQPVDRQNPDRVAVVRGPVVLVLEFDYHDPAFALPNNDEDLNKWLVPCEAAPPASSYRPHFGCTPAVYNVKRPDGRPVRLQFRPFYEMPENFPYLMYVDLKAWPYKLWQG